MKIQTKLILILIPICLFLMSCETFDVDYDIGLSSVERPKDVQERYGDYLITEQLEEAGKYQYEDELINSYWVVANKDILFSIENKTDSTIKIIWDEAAFISQNGESSRIMHSGIKYIDRNNSQPASVIIRKGKFSDLISPTDNVYYNSNYGWDTLPIIKNIFSDEILAKEYADSILGNTLQLLLPLEIEGKVNDYIFVFKIEGYDIEQ